MDIRTKHMRMVVTALLIVHTLACLFPLVWLFCSAFKSNPEFFYNPGFLPQKFSPQNFSEAWTKGKFSDYFMNSVFYTAMTILLVDVVASLAAFTLAKIKSRFFTIIFLLIVVTVMIPAPGNFIQIFTVLQKFGMLGTRTGYVLVMTAISLPTSIFILKGFFESIPDEMVEAARIDGASTLRIWGRICMPLAMPAVATVSILTLLSVWNDYIMAAVIFSDQNMMPIQQGLLVFQGQYTTRYDLLIAATAIAIIPLIVVYTLFNRQVLQGVVDGAVKG